MNIKSGKIEGFGQYSQFSSLQEFNGHTEQWLVGHKDDFSKGELLGLKRLIRFAAKVPGISNAKIGTILKAIHVEYNNNGISRSTFKRMILKAKEIGILTIMETERKNGSQSSNLYIFNRFPSNEPPKPEIMDRPETSNLFETKNNKTINKRQEDAPIKLDHTFVNDRIPQPFIQLVRYFFNDVKTIEEYWHMALIAAYRNMSENKPGRILEVAIESFKQLMRKLKFTRSVRNPFAYYYGILDHKFYDRCCRDRFEEFFMDEEEEEDL